LAPRDTFAPSTVFAYPPIFNAQPVHKHWLAPLLAVADMTRSSPFALLPNSIRADPDLSSATPSSDLSAVTMSSSSSANLAPTLTPLTTNESSPPDKPLSPLSRKRSFDQMRGSRSPSRRRADSPASLPGSPSEPVRRARPGPGEVKGYKIAFDPETAPGLDAKDRRKYKAKYNSFGDKVRAASSQVMPMT
jgi:histone-lysine N-methyltransferase SETD1